ncbi:hypothetical protein RF11_03365 [Thelohanellus kitauei]|uniref:Uncharacterized protein n=1 Tax=Thelohanellus kitauei TaxID=669202 RepID=A0A0C2J1C5_THEKT|nr:hypothetical protein RF11_03365 [Thelohanellus kitauei]
MWAFKQIAVGPFIEVSDTISVQWTRSLRKVSRKLLLDLFFENVHRKFNLRGHRKVYTIDELVISKAKRNRDPVTGVHTNNVKAYWGEFKNCLKEEAKQEEISYNQN